ncbi:tellurite resistance TerB family protein [Chelativorans intermedius]|uniref:TerB family tellurite resistance protein n=1 Tax=Chelativorans intermedius TaxID=515947 RepID=A0ABV6DBU8_9HYPH|nr:TerB family tellurite resistance protein [Chelativorans intermedius]MCT8997913.1 TerB family tellurite resistance protein [Chelativorans intermedius]
MFERILSFLKDLPAAGDASQRPEADDPRVAAAALLIHVMAADGERSSKEQKRLRQALSSAYDLHGAELKALMKAAEEAEAEAVDLYTFTSVLKRHLDEAARAEFIRCMWEIVFADGTLHELEDNLVWRVAELLGVDTRTRVVMRQRVQEERERREG